MRVLAGLLAALNLALASCWTAPAPAASVPLSSLGARGQIVCTDQVPNLPAGASTLQASTACDVQNFVLTSIKSTQFAGGAKGDGSTDDTAAWQAAITSGLPIYCPPGIYKTSSTLNFTGTTNNGQVVTGAGPTNDTGATTAGRCIIRPTSAVSTAVNISGTSPTGPWILGLSIRDLTLDMVNMAAGSTGFSEAFEYDSHQSNIRVVNDVGKHSMYFTTGSELTTLTNFQGSEISIIGTGVTNPTTITLVNPDIGYLVATSVVNITVVGGAIQPRYSAGYTPIAWVPAGTGPLNFANPSGMYVAKGVNISTAWNISFWGTDLETGGFYPNPTTSGCTGVVSTYAYNDGTHGCAPLAVVADFDTGAYGVNITGGDWVVMYPYFPAGLSSAANISPSFNSGNALAGDYHLGYQYFRNLTATPQSDPATDFTVTNAAGGLIFGCTSNATLAASQCGQLSGTLLRGWNTANTVSTWTLNGSTGALSLYSQTIQPATDGVVFTLNNAAGSLYFVCSSAAATTSAKCETYGGAVLDGWNSGNSALTWSISGATGQATFYSEVIKPATDGTILTLNNSANSSFMICSSNATLGNSFCSVGGGADWRGFSDSLFTVQTYDFDAATGTGTFTGILKGATLLATGAGGVGYATGAGGTVTQATSRTTGVTLNKTTGSITLFSAAGSATAATFTVTNSTVAATDVVDISQKSGTNLYNVMVTAVAAGSFNVTFQTTGGTATDAPVFNFTVIKGVTS